MPQVFWVGPVAIVNLKDDLILIVRLLDQVDVVLRVSRAEKVLELGGRYAVDAGAVTVDIDIEARRVPKEIGPGRSDEAVVVTQLGAEGIGRGINFRRVNAADNI